MAVLSFFSFFLLKIIFKHDAMKQMIELNVPKQLELLCDLLETTPQQILQGFINDVSLEVNSNGSDERRMAVEYFMRCSYG